MLLCDQDLREQREAPCILRIAPERLVQVGARSFRLTQMQVRFGPHAPDPPLLRGSDDRTVEFRDRLVVPATRGLYLGQNNSPLIRLGAELKRQFQGLDGAEGVAERLEATAERVLILGAI